MASRYHEVYDELETRPGSVLGGGGRGHRLVRRWDNVFDADAGVYGRWFTGAHLQHLLQLPRPPCRARPRRPDRADPRQRRSPARVRRFTYARAAARGGGARRRAARTAASARATASSSTCRWWRRRPSPCSPAPASAPCIRWCSAASPRNELATRIDDARPKLIDLGLLRPRARPRRRLQAAARPGDRAVAAIKPRRLPDPAARRSCAASSSPGRDLDYAEPSRRDGRAGATSTACRSPPPIRSTSSTPQARPASPRASCATMAATWSR